MGHTYNSPDVTRDKRSECPLSSTEIKVDACITEDCPAYIETSGKCFYILAVDYGLDLIDKNTTPEHNIFYMHDFQMLFTEHYDRIFKVAYRMLKSVEMAEDIAQEVFIRACKSARKIGPDAPLSAWLYRVTTNLCLDELRRRKACAIESFGDLDVEELYEKFKTCNEMDPESIVREREGRAVIDKVLRSMPDRYRQALLMRCVDGLSYEAIACAMGSTVAGIRSIIYRARKHFVTLYTELSQ